MANIATSFIYNRTVSFYREATQLVTGEGGYLAHNRATEQLLFSAVPASVQCPSVGTRRIGDGALPDDAAGPVRWNIFLQANAIPLGGIKSRDIVIDDIGDRYQVVSSYWTSLGFKIQTVRLEA